MAKTTNCVFCGKELKTGFFKGDDFFLDTGAGSITCCEACHDKYRDEMKRHKERFGTKVDNLKNASKRRLSEKELAEMYLQYTAEEQKQLAKCGTETADQYRIWFSFNDRRYFGMKELRVGAGNNDVSAKQMLKTLDKTTQYDSLCFDKDDVTKLEFRQAGIGSTLSLFATAYSYEIRLNDEKILTYKPCITKTMVVGKGLFTKKAAEKQMYTLLETFKREVGVDLPIVKVKKFL